MSHSNMVGIASILGLAGWLRRLLGKIDPRGSLGGKASAAAVDRAALDNGTFEDEGSTFENEG